MRRAGSWQATCKTSVAIVSASIAAPPTVPLRSRCPKADSLLCLLPHLSPHAFRCTNRHVDRQADGDSCSAWYWSRMIRSSTVHLHHQKSCIPVSLVQHQRHCSANLSEDPITSRPRSTLHADQDLDQDLDLDPQRLRRREGIRTSCTTARTVVAMTVPTKATEQEMMGSTGAGKQMRGLLPSGRGGGNGSG